MLMLLFDAAAYMPYAAAIDDTFSAVDMPLAMLDSSCHRRYYYAPMFDEIRAILPPHVQAQRRWRVSRRAVSRDTVMRCRAALRDERAWLFATFIYNMPRYVC